MINYGVTYSLDLDGLDVEGFLPLFDINELQLSKHVLQILTQLSFAL